MRWVVLLLPFCLLPASACETAVAQDAQWYDPAPLLQSLRAADRRELSERTAPFGVAGVPFYDINLSLTDDQTTFRAVEDVWYTNQTGEPLTDVVLRIFANSLEGDVRVHVANVVCIGATCETNVDTHERAITLRPAEAIPPGGHLHARLRLEGHLTHIDPARTGMMAQAMESQQRLASGNMHGDYGLLAESAGTASLGNFYAMVAARRDGQWVRSDDSTMGDLGSGDISHFRARVSCEPGSQVITSGRTIREETVIAQPPRHQVEAVAAMARNFAIVVSRTLTVAEREVNGVTVRSWFEPADRADGESVLASAAEAMRIFEARFGRYPYTDLDVVEAPLVGGAGGVEFSGLVTIAKMFYPSGGGSGLGIIGALMGGSQNGGGMRESMLEFVVAHEVAHQWWHGLVGSDARIHPFVDESLAQFSSIQYMQDRHGSERAELEARRQVAANYHMMRAQGVDDGAVDRPVSAFQHPMAYAGLVYGKGAFAYREVKDAVGERVFFRALRRYVANNRFGVAEPRSLFGQLARGRHRRVVRRIERRWLDQSHGDDDLGEANMGQLMADWVGGTGGGMGPIMNQIMRSLGGGGPSSGSGGSGSGSPGIDGAALQDAVRAIQGL